MPRKLVAQWGETQIKKCGMRALHAMKTKYSQSLDDYRCVLLDRFVKSACTRGNDNQTSRSHFEDPRSHESSLERKMLGHIVGTGMHFMLTKRLLTPVLVLSMDKVSSL